MLVPLLAVKAMAKQSRMEVETMTPRTFVGEDWEVFPRTHPFWIPNKLKPGFRLDSDFAGEYR